MSENPSSRQRLMRIGGTVLLVLVVAFALDRFASGSEYPLVNAKAPAISLTSLDGAPLPIGDNLGKKVVVINFWATWCGPCRMELPEFSQLATEYPDKPVAFYAVAIDEEKDLITTAVNETDPRPPVAYDPGAAAQEAFQINSYPTTVVIGKDGVIHAGHIGYGPGVIGEIKQEINSLL